MNYDSRSLGRPFAFHVKSPVFLRVSIFTTFPQSFVEVYNLTSDASQLENIVKKVDPALLQAMNQQLIKLQSCAGSSCHDSCGDGSSLRPTK